MNQDMNDHLKPLFHVRPATGWVNDPNGPVIHDGQIHLFFQSRPRLSLSTPVEWGHATSSNMATWTVHESAITPDIHPAAVDGVYSGVTVSTPAGLRAFFSGYRNDHPYQTVLTALSQDNGHSFTAAEIAVSDPTNEDGILEYRDPFVFFEDDQWHMVVGASTTNRRGVILHYVSKDLGTWVKDKDLLAAPSGQTPWGWMWECPQIVTSADGLLALFSVMDDAIEGFGPTLSVPVLQGDPDTDPQLVDHGPAFYAPSVLNRQGRPSLLWGWITESRTEDWWLEEGWAGALTLPRTITAQSNGEIRYKPIDAIKTLRDAPLALTESRNICVLPTGQLEIQWELPQAGGATLSVAFSSAERFTLNLSSDRRELTIDNSHASQDNRAFGGTYALPVDIDDTALQIFIDGSIVEIFTSHGRAATFRVYPKSAPPWHLTTTAGKLRGWTIRPGVSHAQDVIDFRTSQDIADQDAQNLEKA